MEVVGKAGLKGVCKVGMDEAVLEFKGKGEDCYDLGTRYAETGKKPGLKMTGAALADVCAGLCKGYPLIVALPQRLTLPAPCFTSSMAAPTRAASLHSRSTSTSPWVRGPSRNPCGLAPSSATP